MEPGRCVSDSRELGREESSLVSGPRFATAAKNSDGGVRRARAPHALAAGTWVPGLFQQTLYGINIPNSELLVMLSETHQRTKWHYS